MPCNSFGDDITSRTIYVERDNPRDVKRIQELNEQVSLLEAGLCAIINELEKREIAESVISDANKNGMINIMEFWKRHSESDEVRLLAELNKFSEHEKEVLKQLLKKTQTNR
jgi:hypothetical protein